MQIVNSRIALLNQSVVVAAMTSLADAIRSVHAPPTSNVGTLAPNLADMDTGDTEQPTTNTSGGGQPACDVEGAISLGTHFHSRHVQALLWTAQVDVAVNDKSPDVNKTLQGIIGRPSAVGKGEF